VQNRVVRNYAIQIWWRSVKGFRVGWGSKFTLSHWLWRSPLQHSHTTVWACDRTYTSLLSVWSQILVCPAEQRPFA